METVAEDDADDADDEPVVDGDVEVVAVVDDVVEDVLDPPQPASAATSISASSEQAGRTRGMPRRDRPIEGHHTACAISAYASAGTLARSHNPRGTSRVGVREDNRCAVTTVAI